MSGVVRLAASVGFADRAIRGGPQARRTPSADDEVLDVLERLARVALPHPREDRHRRRPQVAARVQRPAPGDAYAGTGPLELPGAVDRADQWLHRSGDLVGVVGEQVRCADLTQRLAHGTSTGQEHGARLPRRTPLTTLVADSLDRRDREVAKGEEAGELVGQQLLEGPLDAGRKGAAPGDVDGAGHAGTLRADPSGVRPVLPSSG